MEQQDPSSESKGQMPPKRTWDFEKFIANEQKYIEQQREDLKKKRELAQAAELAVVSSAPTINPVSKKIVKSRPKDDLHHRLYKEGHKHTIGKETAQKDENCVHFRL